ncbi:MAG TPA: hypothetical protein VIF57_05280, partial [Polyangia bacterium]
YNLLFVFRFLTAIGHVVFLVAMLMNVALSLRELPTPVRLPWRVGALAVAVIASHPAIIDYLVEFRLDSWPNALLMIAIYRYRSRRWGPLRSSIELAALSMAAILCSPKLVLFVGMFGALSIVMDDQRPKRVVGMLAGGLGMLALGAGFLLAAGHNPVDVYRLALRYHRVLNDKGGFGHGVYEIVLALKILRNVVIASIVAWPLVGWRRIHRSAFEIAVLLFLILQLKMVGFGYKQYYAPWYLLAIAFLPYLEVLTRRVKVLNSVLLAIAVLYVADNVLPSYRGYQDGTALNADLEARKALEAQVPPGHFVIASIETRPLFRRDALYQHHNSYAPSGYDGTRVMQELNVQPYSGNFTVDKALAAIEAHKPDLIITNARLPGYVRTAMEKYLAKHRDEYVHQDGFFGSYMVRKR